MLFSAPQSDLQDPKKDVCHPHLDFNLCDSAHTLPLINGAPRPPTLELDRGMSYRDSWEMLSLDSSAASCEIRCLRLTKGPYVKWSHSLWWLKDKLVTEPPLGPFGTLQPPALAVCCGLSFVTSHCQTQSQPSSYVATGNGKLSNVEPPPTIQPPVTKCLSHLPSRESLPSIDSGASPNYTPTMSPGLRVTSPLTVSVHSAYTPLPRL